MPHPITQCPECYKQLTTSNTPHLLSCNHSICASCCKLKGPSPISCPFCNTPTTFKQTIPEDATLLSLVGALSLVSRSHVGELCELHDGKHPANYWCTACERGLCNEARLTHGKTPATKSHKIIASNAERPALRKPVVCAVHGSALDQVCAHASHAPRMVCGSCVQQSHQGHTQQSGTQYFEDLCVVAHKFVEQAQKQQGAESTTVYEKMDKDIEDTKDIMGQQLSDQKANKENVLHSNLNALYSILDGISEKLHQKVADKPKEQIKATKEERKPQQNEYDDNGDYEDEEEEEDEIDDYEDDPKRFTGGRKNEFGGGKSTKSNKW